MRRESFKQYFIIRADNPEDLTDQLNEKMMELRTNRPEVTFSEQGQYMFARICYNSDITIIEDRADEYVAKGVKLTCSDCPIFKPPMKRDGTTDERKKYGDCKFSEYGRTARDTAACDTLFTMIDNGEVRLCLADSE